MIRLRTHQEDIDKGTEEDLSEIWCRRLDEPDHDYRKSEETLVHALTFACEKVFEKSPESIAILDAVLRNQRWKIFQTPPPTPLRSAPKRANQALDSGGDPNAQGLRSVGAFLRIFADDTACLRTLRGGAAH